MNNKRICHFTTVHKRTDVRIFYKQCMSLVKAGFDVHLVVSDGKGDDIKNGIKIHDIGKMKNRLTRMLFGPVKMFFLLRNLNCRVYQFHDPELLPMAFYLKKVTQTKVIYDSHECYSDYFMHKDYLPKMIRPFCSKAIKVLEKFVGKYLDWVIVTTTYHAESLKGINKHIDIVYNYPLLSEWNEDNSADNRDNSAICYIGNIIEERGMTQLIKAIEPLDCVLHLAGGYEPQAFRDELMKLAGWKKVIEYGYVDRKKATDIVSNSLVGVILFQPKPIHYTSLSTKAFEYMAGGTACIVPDFPIWQDIVAKNNCGICVDPTDVEQISKQLRYLMDNPNQAKQMGKNGKQMIQKQYNWELQETILLDIYQQLTNDNTSDMFEFSVV